MRVHTVRVAFGSALLSATLLAPLPGWGGGSPQFRVSANLRVAGDRAAARGFDVPGLAVDPADPRHMVVVAQNFYTGQCTYRVTFDAGRSWVGGDFRAPEGFGSKPCIQFDSGGYSRMDGGVAFGSAGAVYAVFSSIRGNEGDSVILATSVDGGRTFAPGIVVLPGGPLVEPIYSRPKVGVHRRPSGDRIVVEGWSSIAKAGTGPGKAYRAVVTVSDDLGESWSAPTSASPLGQTAREISRPAFGADGSIYLAWKNQDLGGLVVGRSADGGKTWTSTTVAPTTVNPKIAVDPRSGGSTVYVVHQTAATQPVLLQRSVDSGVTWSAPTTVSDEAAVAPRLPAIAASPGRIDVVWQDRRHEYSDEKLSDYYLATSTDGGTRFTGHRRVTDRSINRDIGLDSRIGGSAFYSAAIESLGTRGVAVAWTDTRAGNVDNASQDIYLANVGTNGAAPLPAQRVSSSSSEVLSAALSRTAYPGGGDNLNGQPNTRIVIVGATDSLGAFPAAVLARDGAAPLLVSPAGGLPASIRAEVRRLRPAGAYVVGDTRRLSSRVVDDLVAAGVPRAEIVRLSGPTPAATAAAIAAKLGASAEAVVVNPLAPESRAALALAAAARLPVLFTDRTALPAETSKALKDLGVQKTLVIGGPDTVSQAVLARLPGARRLGGGGALATSGAVATETRRRGMPVSVAYVADPSSAVDWALTAATVGRVGGLLVLVPGADGTRAERLLRDQGMQLAVDRLVLIRPTG